MHHSASLKTKLAYFGRMLAVCSLLVCSLFVCRPGSAQDWQGHLVDAATLPTTIIDDVTDDRMEWADMESMALANNPTLSQAHALIRASRASAYQAGRFLNPRIGYTSDQIGIAGTAGELQGAFFSQEIVTGGKLRLSRAKWDQRARIATTHLAAQQQRVINDVKVLFFKTIAAQRLLAIQEQVLSNAEDDLQTHREMLNLGQTNQAGMLQAEIDLQQNRLNLQTTQNQLDEAWRHLVTMVGVPGLPQTILSGSLQPDDSTIEWDSALVHLLGSSPELIAARQKVCHDVIAVQRERVEPIPNITVGATTGYNFETDDSVAGVTVGIPLPIFDKNLGTVRQAQADLSRSRSNVQRVELELTTRLAAEFRRYQTAVQHVSTYQSMLPKSKQAYDLMHQSYKNRRAAWPDVLVAQRRYLDLQTVYVERLLNQREADIAIRGMLLSGGLSEPPAPMSGGHRDATPKPR